MSKAGYHWKVKDEKRAVPCLKCGTEPRMENHTVCPGCHREDLCPKCHPELAVAVPVHQMRGALSTEAEEGWTY